MTLEDLGYTHKLERLWNVKNLKEFEIGRVVSEHKERYIVSSVSLKLPDFQLII